jgi:hypothetical protein
MTSSSPCAACAVSASGCGGITRTVSPSRPRCKAIRGWHGSCTPHCREMEPLQVKGPLVRLHAGLENVDDLILDVKNALRRAYSE